jgi:hypothetical protein
LHAPGIDASSRNSRRTSDPQQEAASEEIVEEVCRHAGLGSLRIVEAVE